jgi:CubicO group peptidase (beta-lactamase class C family)
VAALVGKGVLQWRDPMTKYLPWFKLIDPVITEQVTVGDMFAMRSGPPANAGDDLELFGYSRKQILERLAYVPLNQFRTSYAYVNYSLVAGAQAAAAAASKPWDTVVREQIFDPLGMSLTSSRYDDFLSRVNRAALHVPVGDHYESLYERSDALQAPAGSISTTVLDMSRWLRMELANGSFEGRQVVASKAHVRRIGVGGPVVRADPRRRQLTRAHRAGRIDALGSHARAGLRRGLDRREHRARATQCRRRDR